MKKYLLIISFFISSLIQAQTITLIDPSGLTSPYEVAPGTEVTFKWDYFGSPPVIFTDTEEPNLPPFGTDPSWTQSEDYVDNGDGTFNFTVQVNQELWIWGGYYQSFFGSYAYSNIIHVNIASGVVITSEDGYLCPSGDDSELLSVQDTYDSYQWYKDGSEIPNADSDTYSATTPGAYKVQVPLNGQNVFSNTLTISNFSVDVSGEYDSTNSQLTLMGTGGFDSYQWYSGNDTNNLLPIDNATQDTFTTALPGAETYYALEVTSGSCTITSDPRLVIPASFQIPLVSVSADTNSYGNVCNGTTVTLSTNDIYDSYDWQLGGMDQYVTSPSMSVSQDYQAGEYQVQVSPVGWPEIALLSQPIEVNFFSVTSPNIISDDNDGNYCPGQEVNIVLGDEGYSYSWYVHTDYNYTPEDLIDVTGNTYTFNFEEAEYVTVVATNQGCSSESTLSLYNIADQSPSISLVNWDDQYLCTDSAAAMSVGSWNSSDYQDYQWLKEVNGEMQPIAGATDLEYDASDTGTYGVQAQPVGCPVVESTSNTITIESYLDRPLDIYADADKLCIGDTTELHIPGGDSWQNIQWFRKKIIIGSNGYQVQYDPMIGGGDSATQAVSQFNSYEVKARYEGCLTGQKITSNIISIAPRVNPTISLDPNYGIASWHPAPFDSIASYVYCSGQTVSMQVPETYDAYDWMSASYTGDDGYTPGNSLGDTTSNAEFTATGADWVTVLVDSAGCQGYSDPVLLDTWVFQSPDIASIGNAELCGEGDSTLLHIAFPGDWISYQWFLDGQAIVNSDNDSIYVSQPGEYTVTCYPEQCPDFGLSSGVGPDVSYLTAQIGENDTVIYAIPELGDYSFQWYLNGDSISSPANTPWLLYKDSLVDGTYTVEVTNADSCSSFSDPYLWNTTGINLPGVENMQVLPNPTTDYISISGISPTDLREISIYDLSGKKLIQLYHFDLNRIDLSGLQSGIYLLQLQTGRGLRITKRLVKE